MELKTCSKCHVTKEISEFTRDLNKKDGHRCSCKECEYSRKKEYYEKNKERIKEHSRENYEKTRERVLFIKRRYHRENQEARSEYRKKYIRTPAGKFTSSIITSKKRGLGFNPLNNTIPGYDCHHLFLNGSNDLCIFIPPELHRSVRHDSKNGEGMKKINNAALLWLCEQAVI